MYIRTALLVIGVVLVLALMSMWSRSPIGRTPPAVLNKIDSLTREAARLQAMALQDQNPIFGLLHATHAVCYARIAQQLSPYNDGSINLDEFVSYLSETEQAKIQYLTSACPSLTPVAYSAVATGYV